MSAPKLHVVATAPKEAAHDCQGYTCQHPRCVADRARLAARGARPRAAQPWDTRRAA